MNTQNSIKILVVEDEAIIALTEQKQLESYGYHVITAPSGKKALDILEKHQDVDLILMDINLGSGMDGTEAANQILSSRSLPIVFLSSHVEKEVVEKTETISSYGYIVKGSGINVLDASIKMALKLFAANKKLQEQTSRLATTLHSIGDAVIVTDITGNVTQMNAIAEHLTGYRFADAKDKPLGEIFRIINSKTRKAVESPVDKVLEKGQIVGLANHTMLISKDGTEYQIADSGAPIKDLNGVINGVVLVFRDVSEDYQLREKVDSNEKLFRGMFEQSGDGVAIHDLEGHILDVNQRLLDIFEYSREEFLKLHVIDVLSKSKESQKTGKLAFKTLEKTGFAKFESEFMTKSGQLLFGNVTTSIVNIDGKKIAQFIFKDHTARKKAEEQVRISEDKYRIILNNADLFVSVYDHEGVCQFMNSSVAKQFGGSAEQFVGKSFRELHPPESEEYIRRIQEVIDSGKTAIYEDEVVFPEGNRWLFSRVQPFPDTSGELNHAQIISQDFTERKAAELALNKSEILFRTIIEQSGDGIGLTNEKGKYLIVNPAFCQMTGYSEEEMLSKHILDLVPKEENITLFPQVVAGKKGEKVLELVKKDGSRFIAQINGYPVELKEQRMVLGIVRDITEQIKSEKALIESENKFRSIAENASDFIFIKDKERKYRFVNQAMLTLLGQEKEQILGKTPDEIFGPDEGSIVREVDDKTFSGMTISETRQLHIGYNQLVFHTVQAPLKIENGEVQSIMGIVRDVTAQTLAERKFRTIFEMSLDMICIADLNSTSFLEVNPAFTRILGYKKEELLNHSFLDYIHPEDVQPTIDVVETELKKGNTILRFQNRYKTKKGDFRWLDWNSHPIPEQGITYAIAHDITEWKSAEKALQESNEKRRLVFEHAPIGIMHFDKTGTIIECNETFAQIIGAKKNELIGYNMLESMPLGEARQAIADTLTTGSGNFEGAYTTISTKKEIHIKASHKKITNDEGDFLMAVGIFEDISERIKSEEQIKNLLQEKDMLLREVHHRIKNNMIVMKSLLSLQADRVDDKSAKSALETAKERMTSMMVLYDKIYREEPKDEISMADYLTSLVSEIVSTYPNRVNIEKQIDNITIPVRIASTLGIIINELISNAMKYAFNNQITDTIKIEARQFDDQIVLIISDNGVGMNIEKTGKGFGLELVETLTNQLDGEFNVDNSNGTTCTLKFEV